MECPSDSFAAFYDNAAFSDVVLKARDTKMHAHKLVLAAHSASLQAMFQVTAFPVWLFFFFLFWPLVNYCSNALYGLYRAGLTCISLCNPLHDDMPTHHARGLRAMRAMRVEQLLFTCPEPM